ncbi:Hypothetical predicted protein, partial [Prunus dulcis]
LWMTSTRAKEGHDYGFGGQEKGTVEAMELGFGCLDKVWCGEGERDREMETETETETELKR